MECLLYLFQIGLQKSTLTLQFEHLLHGTTSVMNLTVLQSNGEKVTYPISSQTLNYLQLTFFEPERMKEENLGKPKDQAVFWESPE